MRNATDEQLRASGWKWALRYQGRVIAVTVSAFDAGQWMKERTGEVMNLDNVAALPPDADT